MLKKFYFSFFKKVTFLTLLSFSVLLIVINNPHPSGGGGAKPSSFDIKQQTLHVDPTEPEKQAVWTFLKAESRLTNLQISKVTLYDKNTQDLLFYSLFKYTTTSTTYAELTNPQKTVLSKLFEVTRYQDKINSQIEFVSIHASDAWTFLKSSDNLGELKKYQIQRTPYFSSFSSFFQIDNYLETEFASLSMVQKSLLYEYSQSLSYVKETQDAIKSAKTAASAAWTFLQTNNRLANIKTYDIKIIDTIALLPVLENVLIAIDYSCLTTPQQTQLYLLSQRPEYQREVDDAIRIAQTDTSNAWTFLITSDRLTNLKKYDIKTIDTVALLPILESVEPTVAFENLSLLQQTALYLLIQKADYQDKVNAAIQKAENADSVWTVLKTNDRLANLKQYQIKIIDGIALLPAFTYTETSVIYKDLSPFLKNLLYNLSQLAGYQQKITNAIALAQHASEVWTFLTTEDRLVNIQQYQISTIDTITLLPALGSVTTSTPYINLSNSQKNALYDLSQRASYQRKITDAINIAQDTASVWTFLTSNDRLANLKQYQLQTIDTIRLLPVLASVTTSTRYTDLSPEQKTTLYTLFQRAGYQQKVTDAIQIVQITSDVLFFLKTENRLANLKQYQIKIIDGIALLPNLVNIESSTRYTDLSSAQKTLLYTLSKKTDYQNKVTDVIQNAEAVSLEVWIFLRESNRLKNLKKYNINKIETVTLLPLWKINPLSMNYINFLINEQKFTLNRLSKIIEYEAKIDTAITQAKKQTLALWNYLITTNALKKIQEYEINKIADVDISSLMSADAKKTFDQQNDNVQDEIIKLKELSDYKLKIQNEIKKAKAVSVWVYLKKSKRLQNIKKYKITMINGIDVYSLKTANVDQDYTEQNNDVKKDLIALSKISSFENKIDQKIKNHTTIEDSNDRTLLTGIILLSLFGFLFLTAGTGFYVYKKFWLSKTKK